LIRCTTIAGLVNTPTTDLQSSLQLSSGLYSVALQLGREDGPAPAQLANFLATKLVPALESDQSRPSTSDGTSQDGSEGKQVLEDGLIDVVWQVHQDLDNGLLEHLIPTSVPTSEAPPAEGEAMEVDGANKSEEEVAKERAARVAAVQTRLAQFTAWIEQKQNLVSAQACKERLEVTFLALPGLQLIPNAQNFFRREVQTRTAL
jgi:hypothetical protein